MSMFSTNLNPDQRWLSAIADPSAKLSMIAPGTTVVGEIQTDGVVKVEGRVEGSVKSAHQVLVAKGGSVIGDITAQEAVIAGEVEGEVATSGRLELKAGCLIRGDVTTPTIMIEEGGRLEGELRMARSKTGGQQSKADVNQRHSTDTTSHTLTHNHRSRKSA